MKKIFDILQNNPLFQGIAFSDFELMLNCLSARTASYKKDEVVLLSGDTVNFVGLIISGGVRIVKEDIEGRVTLLNEFGASELFGEVFACAEVDHSPVTVLATEETEILRIDYRKIITACSAACPFHAKLIENMLKLIAARSLMLNQKIEILSKRTIRERLFVYFDQLRGSRKKFTIPCNQGELALYLCVDRSAMSNELSKMQNEGLIQFQKKAFEIHY